MTTGPLRDHGDQQVPPGAVDLAVNVEPGPPAWLARRLRDAVVDLAPYPDDRPARVAIARATGRAADEVLLCNGAAEAFWLLAAALRPQRACVVHPEFTEGEAALRAAGVDVVRAHRQAPAWSLADVHVPGDADLVLLGRPGNPTGAMDPVDAVAALCRPGRTVVVDEAFVDFVPEPDALARRRVPGLVLLRSATKLWGLAGLRLGHVLGPAEVVQRLHAVRQPWSTNHLAIVAAVELADRDAERRQRADDVRRRRARLVQGLARVDGLQVWASPANWVLVRSRRPDLRARLLEHGIAVRRGESFPGLDEHWIRVAVRDEDTIDRVVDTVRRLMKDCP